MFTDQWVTQTRGQYPTIKSATSYWSFDGTRNIVWQMNWIVTQKNIKLYDWAIPDKQWLDLSAVPKVRKIIKAVAKLCASQNCLILHRTKVVKKNMWRWSKSHFRLHFTSAMMTQSCSHVWEKCFALYKINQQIYQFMV